MIPALFTAMVLAAGLSAAPADALRFPQRVALPGDDRAIAAEFQRRLDQYLELRLEMTAGLPPLEVTTDIGAIQRTVDMLAIAIKVGRAGAQRGDLFSPDVAALVRRVIRTTCRDQFSDLLALINEDWDAPLPAAVVHGRWPDGTPLPTMPPDLLAALPRLPPLLEYRFINRDLVLRDVDANLIIDVVVEAIPAPTWTSTSR
jgi:hypothetical protein